ncbi:hypothetical protein Bbelb_190830 [Branchiostoma belcheri]|nr:hypothetical protein Bbelb_190830 [Branchiostoma belcheri]
MKRERDEEEKGLEERRKRIREDELNIETGKRKLKEMEENVQKKMVEVEREKEKVEREKEKVEAEVVEVEREKEKIKVDFVTVEREKEKIKADVDKLYEKEKEIDRKKDETEVLLEALQQLLRDRRMAPRRKPTTQEMVEKHMSTWYKRKKETKELLSFIHGDLDGAVMGAWHFICSVAGADQVDKFLTEYKKGKYLQGKMNTLTKKFVSTDDAVNQAVAMKYKGFLSRRKYDIQCRTLSSVFDPSKKVWLPRNIKVDGVDVSCMRQLSHNKLDMFVKAIDIGHLHHIPRELGVTRSVTALVHMIVDLHLRVPHLEKQLCWFNNRKNHFIFQFSDDGTQEAAETPMSVGSLTCWNFHKRVSSRDLHYLLHIVSTQETDAVMADLWRQHTQEMELLEGSTFTINESLVTFQFVPSADQKWQCWANNETTNAATFPSPFADVSKHNMVVVNGSVGTTWKPWTAESRQNDASRVEEFLGSLPPAMSLTAKKAKLNAFLATNRLRQLGQPRIGKYSGLQRPDPLHAEINCAAHYLNLLYHEAVSRGTDCFHRFLAILQAPVHCSELAREQQSVAVESQGDSSEVSIGVGARARASVSVTDADKAFMRALQDLNDDAPLQDAQCLGLGLKSLSRDLQDHFNNEATRHNRCPTRLIGEHAVMLESYGYRLVDSLQVADETPTQELRRLVLGKVGESLRDAASIFSQVQSDEGDLQTLEMTCSRYYNLLCLFIPDAVTLPVWTLAKAIPHHARILWNTYHVGYGILSLQAKESKHAALKTDLGLTNRSKAPGTANKWVQVFRSNYIRSFYLEEYWPSPPSYNPHFHCRVPKHAGQAGHCLCGRDKVSEDGVLCGTCERACDVLKCADEGALSPTITRILKPHECSICRQRFADGCALAGHTATHQSSSPHAGDSDAVACTDPRLLTVVQLREECRRHGLAVSGRKAELGFGGSSALYG